MVVQPGDGQGRRGDQRGDEQGDQPDHTRGAMGGADRIFPVGGRDLVDTRRRTPDRRLLG